MAEMLTNEEIYKLGEDFLRGADRDGKRFLLLYWIEKSEDGKLISFDFKHRTTPKRHRISVPIEKYTKFGDNMLEMLGCEAGEAAAQWAYDEDRSQLLSGQPMMAQLCTLRQ